MKKIYSILVFCAVYTMLYGQDFSVRYETGIGQYNMKEMKAFQIDLRNLVSDLDVKSVVQFPSTLYYGFEAAYHLNKKNAVGVHLFYNSTAGRNHLADYSGEYKMDMLLSSYAAGVGYRYTFGEFGKFKVSACFDVGIRLSGLKFKEDLVIYGDSISHYDNMFYGTNFYTLQVIEVSYPVLSKLDLILKAGYEIDFRSKYVTKNDNGEEQVLYYKNNEPLNIDYSGFRIGLGISYKL